MSESSVQRLALNIVWLVGVCQPVSYSEIVEFLSLFRLSSQAKEGEIQDRIRLLQKAGCLIQVADNPELFSLTLLGNDLLSRKARFQRDKQRIYLLKNVKRIEVMMSRDDAEIELGDGSSSVQKRSLTKGSETSGIGLVVPRAKFHWSRIAEQLSRAGQGWLSRDANHLEYLSFANTKQLTSAFSYRPVRYSKEGKITMSLSALGLILGVSPILLQRMIRENTIKKTNNNYYRTFELPKKSGGVRQISSPRLFLKVVLRFLNDYFFSQLRVHNSVQSFQKSRSIIDNARLHQNRTYVASIDIQNYFGSITTDNVRSLLLGNGFDNSSSSVIAGLCTKDNALPQGAPTSPVISNAYLYSFDEEMHQSCQARGQTYSRYADDIAISGDDKAQIMHAVDQARRILHQDYGLSLNPKKTRIASKHSQQNVTGIVVNEKLLPPRKNRMKIRAAFHVAKKFGLKDVKQLNELRGYYGYLNAFPELKNSPALQRYKETLDNLTKEMRNTTNP